MNNYQQLSEELATILSSDQGEELLRSIIDNKINEKVLYDLITKEVHGTTASVLSPLFKEIRNRYSAKVIKLNKEEYKIDSLTTHSKIVDLITYLKLFKQAMIVGPTGSGKSTLAEQAADIMKLDFASYSCNEEASKTELIGFNDLSGYNYPNFLRFYENGGVLLIDEYDAMSPGMALVLNAAFDRSGKLSVPTRKENPIAKKHKDFYCVLAGNTWGHASIEYSGRDIQDRAFLDRFKMCRIFIDYDEALETLLVGEELSKFFKSARKIVEEIGVDDEISTRTIVDANTLIKNGRNLIDIVKFSTLHWDKADVDLYINKLEKFLVDYYTSEGKTYIKEEDTSNSWTTYSTPDISNTWTVSSTSDTSDISSDLPF